MTESGSKQFELYMANKKGKPKDDYPGIYSNIIMIAW
jgi:hypothetical protein